MSSIIPGFEYDIFISYRQKDNKHDGWVTAFVENLKGELESTFKEDISVYFDINPHDGLLENHDVNASLKEKLRCLIFIPIISRTYCDPKSFAWEHEFKAFIKLASEDQFGLKVKLPGGNVASRVLPVQIHDLDPEDKKLLEKELGGFIRGVEFIYKEAGVNRPLTPGEDERKNMNGTRYKNQINKVAIAIKEIISGLKLNPTSHLNVNENPVEHDKVFKKKKIKSTFKVSLLYFLVIALSIFIIPRFFKSKDQPEKTIAVLPFRDLSNDTTHFVDGFMEELLNNLQKVKSFAVRSRTSCEQYRDSKKSIYTIGKELNANYLIQGSVAKVGNKRKIWVQLIDVKNDRQKWSNEFLKEMTIDQIFALQSEIAKEIAVELNTIIPTKEVKEIEKKPTKNIEAYNFYLRGNFYYSKSYASQDYETAIKLYEKAVEADPEFAMAYTRIAICLLYQYWFYEIRDEQIIKRSKETIDKAFKIDPDLPDVYVAYASYYYVGHLNYEEALKQIDLALKLQPGNLDAIYIAASVYRRQGNWLKAKEFFLKGMEIDPMSSRISFNTGETFDLLRDYEKAELYYNKTLMVQPDWVYPYHELALMYIRWKGDLMKARKIIEGAINLNKSTGSDSLLIETDLRISLYEGNYEKALKTLANYKAKVFQTQYYFRPKYLYYAFIYDLMNDRRMATIYYDSAKVYIENKLSEAGDDPRLYSSLGIAYGGLGLADKALWASNKALEIMPVSKEAWKGVYFEENLAEVYVMSNRNKEALDKINYLLSIPGVISVKTLELDPKWTKLRKMPEFLELINRYTPQ